MDYKKVTIAALAVFITWEVLDYFIHNVILTDIYGRTASLWRPMEEMKMGLLLVVVLVSAVAYVLIYALLVKDKSIKNGLLFGLLYGLATGIPMGYGMYAVQPFPHILALGWALGSLVESLAAGALVGWLVRK